MVDSTKTKVTKIQKIAVNKLAKEIGIEPKRLLEQFQRAGIHLTATTDNVTEAQKKQLLTYLTKYQAHDTQNNLLTKRNISVRRQETSELHVHSATSRAPKKVSVVTLKKRRRVFLPSQPDETAVHLSTSGPSLTIPAADPLEATTAMAAASNATPEIAFSQVATPSQEASVVNRATAQINEAAIGVTGTGQEEREEVLTSVQVNPDVPVDSKKSSTDKSSVGSRKESRGVQKPLLPTSEVEHERREYLHKKKRNRLSYSQDDRHLALLRGGIDINMVLPQEDEETVPSLPQTSVPINQKLSAPVVNAVPLLAEKVNVQAFVKPSAPMVREIDLPETIRVDELAKQLAVKASIVIKGLDKLGVTATLDQEIDQETAALVVEEIGHRARLLSQDGLERQFIQERKKAEGALQPRPPIITIMGHVDHGKTTLLDYIRRTNVVAQEVGGITQHIGAYRVQMDKGSLTFLDTPGHAAFTAMRARGAILTDIVVLVVAADDGVMPQTIEAIEHAKAAHVPVIVAINKIDKPETDLNRIQVELSKHDLVPESWGGETLFVPLSAKTGQGVDALLEAILLQAEMLELKAPVTGLASGVVIETYVKHGKGAIASVLVQRGTLHKGDIMLAGQAYGRIKALFDEQGQPITKATPSMPVEILGLAKNPQVGDEFFVMKDEKQAKTMVMMRKERALMQQQRALNASSLTAADLLQQMTEAKEKVTVLNVLIKADVQGSLEALKHALQQLTTQTIKINVILSGIGGISESDAQLAMASHAMIIGFNVRANTKARALIEKHHLQVCYHNIIYNIIDAVRQVINNSLEDLIQERVIGQAEVRSLFRSSKTSSIAGCVVVEGIMKRHQPIRLLRDEVVIFEGVLESLRHFKEDVNEVRAGTECGIAIKNYYDVRVGDKVEVFERIAIKQTI